MYSLSLAKLKQILKLIFKQGAQDPVRVLEITWNPIRPYLTVATREVSPSQKQLYLTSKNAMHPPYITFLDTSVNETTFKMMLASDWIIIQCMQINSMTCSVQSYVSGIPYRLCSCYEIWCYCIHFKHALTVTFSFRSEKKALQGKVDFSSMYFHEDYYCRELGRNVSILGLFGPTNGMYGYRLVQDWMYLCL